MTSKALIGTVFDTAPLITCCKFQIEGIPVVDYILTECKITIPPAVEEELIAEKGRYSDALIAQERVKDSRIVVREAKLPPKSVLDFYTLGAGEKAAIELARQIINVVRPRYSEGLIKHTFEAEILNDLLERGFEQRLKELYQQYQAGEISLGYLAEQLGVSTWRAYHLIEERGWRTANI